MSLSYVLSPGVNRPFEAQGGLFRDEAIMLLRRFYVQENERGVCFFLFFLSKYQAAPTRLFFGRVVVCRRMRWDYWLIIYTFLFIWN